MIAIDVKELTKRYAGRAVVDRVSFQVPSSQIFGLLGPNGAGKTTTIKILTGLIRPTAGQVFVLGKDLSRSPIEIKRHIGHVYANMAFYPQLTGPENLRFLGSFYPLGRRDLEARIAELLDFVGLSEEKRKKAGAYSQGMTQRLGIARALLHDPDVLFFDEATSGIDIEGTNLIRSYVCDLRVQGKTICVASHKLDEIEYICDRVGLLDHGRLIALGTPAEMKASLRGVLHKYLVRVATPIQNLEGRDARVLFLKDANVILSSQDLLADLHLRFGDCVCEVDPSLEEVFIWLLHHSLSPRAKEEEPSKLLSAQ